jgi:hypothetical protein
LTSAAHWVVVSFLRHQACKDGHVALVGLAQIKADLLAKRILGLLAARPRLCCLFPADLVFERNVHRISQICLFVMMTMATELPSSVSP